jgi:hypothetical protein
VDHRPTHVADETEQPQKHQEPGNRLQHDVSSIDPVSHSTLRVNKASPRIRLSLEILSGDWRWETGVPLPSSDRLHREVVVGKR